MLFGGVAGLLTLALRKNAAQIGYWVWVPKRFSLDIRDSERVRAVVKLASYNCSGTWSENARR